MIQRSSLPIGWSGYRGRTLPQAGGQEGAGSRGVCVCVRGVAGSVRAR